LGTGQVAKAFVGVERCENGLVWIECVKDVTLFLKSVMLLPGE